MDNKIIIGLVGPMAVGKGAVCEYMAEKYGAKQVRYSTMLRDVADRLFLPHTRDVLIKMSEVLRSTFGDDLMAQVVKKEAEALDVEVVCVDGIRRPQDVITMQDNPNFHLVAMDADIKVRYDRIVKRSENSDDQGKTFEQFEQDNARSTEVTIAEIAKQAEHIIDNNGSFEDLYAQVDALVTKLQS